jgi:hypothetical protein
MLRSILASAVLLVALPAQVIETLGSTTTQPTGASRAKASLFKVDSSALLLEFEFHLNMTQPDTLTFFAYRHHSRTAGSTLEWTHQVSVPATSGPQFVSTGPIALNLVAGNYYAIGVMWNNSLTYFYNTAVPAPLSFGTWQRAHTITGTTFPATISFAGSDAAVYFQRLTTVPVNTVVNTGTGCGATLPPRLVADDVFALNTTTNLELVDAASNTIALYGIASGAAMPVPLPLFGCDLWLDVSGPLATAATITSATGYAALPIALPNDPLLSGLTFTAQGLVFGTLATSFSNAVSFTIQ